MVESIQRDICWVSEFLADDITPEHKKRIRVYFFNYDSYWKRDAIQAQLNHFGKDLLARLNTEVRKTDEVRRSDYPTCCIANAFLGAMSKLGVCRP